MKLHESRIAAITEVRTTSPDQIESKAAERQRRPLFSPDGKLMMIAADHPARRILAAGSNPMAMANRQHLLERIMTALERPGVDGLLGTPDIVEDLLLLDQLHDKVVFGSMNRGGLPGSAWELDDRFTGYSPAAIEGMGLDGGKMLLRLDYTDRATIETISSCANAITELARRRIPALVEPLPVARDDEGKLRLDTTPEALIGAITVASALGETSAYTWLKLPAPDDPGEILTATTLPCLLLGGDPCERAAEVFQSWRGAMALPNVRGLVVGRSLLYPQDDDLPRWVDEAAEIVHSS